MSKVGRYMRGTLAGLAMLEMSPSAFADSAPRPATLHGAGSASSHLVVKTKSIAAGSHLRVAVYANEADFLRDAIAKYDASVDEMGLAQVDLTDLGEGSYAVVVYHDTNKDGRLNRTALGMPKEPFAFSNGVRPKLKRPRFEDTAVVLTPGAQIEIYLRG